MTKILILAATVVAGSAFADAKVGVDVDMDTHASLALGAGLDHWIGHGLVTTGYLYAATARSDDGIRTGLRAGVSVNHDAALLSLPFDGFVRFEGKGGYVDALIGPHWLTRARDFRAHAALGVGAKFDRLSIGIEAGYLNPAPVFGGRMAFSF